jgi:lipoprotein-anchoring transpeptidase ErfK/SrfK
VRALTRRLIELGYRLPGETSDYGPQVFDAVLAFQKAAGLDRTGSMSEEDWRRLASAHTPRPRYRRPANHLEVDLTRQILLVVRAGKVTAVLPVSTGALGNTPEGKWRILRKDPWTTTWLGPAILYRTMTFWRNEVAVHGFPSVPAYPASHGCVRVPMWAADWLYRRTPVGQRIYVYSS